MQNDVAKEILTILQTAQEPLETKEIVEQLKGITRTIILYRLHDLRGEGIIKGKRVGSGKGVWIWWHKNTFRKT